MKRNFLKVLLVAMIFILGTQAFANSGTDKYNPTNLEWFVMDLNSRNIWKDITKDKFTIAYYAKNPNIVAIEINYLPTVNHEYMNNISVSRVNHLQKLAEIKSWDWLKVKQSTKILIGTEKESLNNLLAVQ